MSTEFYHKTQ